MNMEFHPEASLEFHAAADFYENEVPGLGEGFISEVKRISALIETHPAIGTPIDEVFRRVVLVRFPPPLSYIVLKMGKYGLLQLPTKDVGLAIGVAELTDNQRFQPTQTSRG